MEVFVALSTWLLIGLLLALAALGLVAVGWARSRQRVAASTTTSAYGDDLQSLGLSAVRTRSADAPSAPSEELTDEPWEDEISAPTAVARSPLPAKKEPVEEPVRVSVRSAQREEPEVEFDDLGVSSARPVTRPAAPEETSPAETPAEAAPPATDASESDEADAAETEDVEADEASKGGSVEEGTVGVHIAATSPLWQGVDPDAAAYLLEALWTKMEAQSVALLRYEDEAHTYVVEALISQATALSTDDLRAAGNLLSEVPDDRSISLIETEALLSLKYHAHPDEAVGSGAALALNIPDARVLLVADQAKDGEPFDEEQLALLGSYADLLSRLFTERRVEGEDLPEVPARTEAIRPIEAKPAKPEPPAPRKEAALNEAEETWPPVRPRSAILADEMAEARKEERPLAFALVVPEGVETLASGTAEAVAEAETQLFGRLHRVEGTARVERFGELLAGVFCYAGPAFVEAWATRVGNSGESVHIGVALLRARHTDPEMLRADAAAALREAYERGEPCVIVE